MSVISNRWGISKGVAKLTLIAGAMVGVVRNAIRDVIAEVVGAAVSKEVQAVLVVTLPKVLAEIGVLVAESSAKIMNWLKRLVDSVSRLTGDIRALSGLLDRISASRQDGTRRALLNGAFLAQAGGEMLERGAASDLSDGWTAYGGARETLGRGHTAAHGAAEQVVDETVTSALVNNSLQNGGATADKLPDPARRYAGGTSPVTEDHLPMSDGRERIRMMQECLADLPAATEAADRRRAGDGASPARRRGAGDAAVGCSSPGSY